MTLWWDDWWKRWKPAPQEPATLDLEILIAIATLRVRLQRIERNPGLLMQFKKPIELAGLKHRAIRAHKQEQAIGAIGRRYDIVQDKIDEAIAGADEHVEHLEAYHTDLKNTVERMIGDNGDPNETGLDGLDSDAKKD